MIDPVSNPPGAQEIGFTKADHPNCSEILWQNLARNPRARALTGPAGDVSYAELIGLAAQWGNAFTAQGLAPGDRIALFLDDTPSFAAAFFGATRAGVVTGEPLKESAHNPSVRLTADDNGVERLGFLSIDDRQIDPGWGRGSAGTGTKNQAQHLEERPEAVSGLHEMTGSWSEHGAKRGG